MVFLCETKLSGREMRTVRAKFEGYEGMEVDSVGRSGGLAFWWKKGVRCEFVSASVHYMDFVIRDEVGDWRVTGFYGWPCVSDRHLSWQLLRLLGRQSSLPWICIGDYNEILYANEMKGGQRPQWQMNNFREPVDECGLVDVRFEGYGFTWDNGQAGEDNRQSRIDRAMATSDWLDRFPYARLIHLNREWSDHSPIKLVMDRREEGEQRKKRFRFEQVWVGEAGSEEAVRRGFERGGWDMMTALRESAEELQAWKGISIGKIVKLIATKRKQIERLNEGGRTVEEAGQRKAKNHIHKLIDDDGIVRQGDDAVARVATNYFADLFTASPTREVEDVMGGLEGRVTEDMNLGLRQPYCAEEVIEALNQMHPLKAPGPDGMNCLFYQTYWHIVGPLVIHSVLGILDGAPMPDEMNYTHIVLIPKKKAPDKIRDFRPISLCNVIYKLVSKVLANRVKKFLADVVSVNQSAFTPGRLISDNVLIAFELFHHMKNSKSKDGHMAIKLDMAKAYDRVEWDFLDRVLRVMGFDGCWVDRVMGCVTTVSSAVLINGNVKEFFRPGRGLRQGDPLSPYLFILCAEVLSNMLRKSVEEATLHGIRIAQHAPVISHLLFADDSIFFLKACEEEAAKVSEILRAYERASGQLVNLDKTTVSFSRGVSEERQVSIAGCLAVQRVEFQERYLGLPTIIGRSKKPITDIVRNKLLKRLQGWRGKTLSKAGREILIKAVANSLPTYVMSIFKLPAAFCDDLRRLVSRFWWGHEDGKKGISWVSWNQLCKPKCVGGMGFRDFFKSNLALLGKQAWRLLTSPECLWAQLMRGKYYHGSDFLTANLGHNPSYTWRSILGAREGLLNGLRRRIGNGLDTLVWGDQWIPNTQSGRIVSPCFWVNSTMRVAELMVTGGGAWCEDRLGTYLLPFEVERVRNIRLSEESHEDTWYWAAEKDGEYSVRSAYKLLVGMESDTSEPSTWERSKWIWNNLWKVQVWPRIKLFFWQLCNDALATKVNLSFRVGREDVLCPLCQCQIESSIHLFRDCGIASEVWERLGVNHEEAIRVGGIRDWVEGVWRELDKRDYGLFMIGCWALWEARNQVVFEGGKGEVDVVVRRVQRVMDEVEGERQTRSNGEGRRVLGWALEGCGDSSGKVLWGIAARRSEVWEAHVAEAVAALEGLQEAAKAGHTAVIVESDCSQVIDGLNLRKKGRSVFALVVDDILRLCNSFHSVVFSYISRKNNEVAHTLAHVLPVVSGREVWYHTLPDVAQRFISLE
ncbi:uncharacterized protein LOC141631111 [Silene latifolia]|uniref:uncharacterized protein LOC141631111 n=1 Tax=Silene latifolia TaxID=37657 RepID=UPI003D783C6D